MPQIFGAIAAVTVLQACVPSSAGYQDVRSATSSRIRQDVRWYEHDSVGEAEKQTRKLTARPLDATTAAQIALLNNQGLQANFEELGVARSKIVEALRLPNPTVDASLRFRGSEEPEIEVGAMLDLSELLFLPMRNGVANRTMDAAKLSVVGRVMDLALDVRVAFYGYQAAEQNLELRRNILVALRASFEASQRLHEAGNITALTRANERALYEESRIAFARAEVLVAAQREELNALMGIRGKSAKWTTEARLPDAAPLASLLNNFEQTAIRRSLDLEASRYRFESARKRANLSRLRGWLPELKGGVSAERAEGGWGVGPAAALEIPLFYQGQGETGSALAEARQEQKLYADTAQRVRAVARSTALRLEAAAKSANYFKSTLLPLRQEIIEQTQLEYNAMGIGVFQLLQAKRDQIAAAQDYVTLLKEYWTLRAEAEQLLAGRLPNRGIAESTRDGESLEQRRGGGVRQH